MTYHSLINLSCCLQSCVAGLMKEVLREHYIGFMQDHLMNGHFSLTWEAYELIDHLVFHITALLIHTHTTSKDK